MPPNDLPNEVAHTVESLPDPPLSGRDLRDVGPGPSGMVAVPVDTASPPRVRLYFAEADVVAWFKDDAEEWVVELVASPDAAD